MCGCICTERGILRSLHQECAHTRFCFDLICIFCAEVRVRSLARSLARASKVFYSPQLFWVARPHSVAPTWCATKFYFTRMRTCALCVRVLAMGDGGGGRRLLVSRARQHRTDFSVAHVVFKQKSAAAAAVAAAACIASSGNVLCEGEVNAALCAHAHK